MTVDKINEGKIIEVREELDKIRNDENYRFKFEFLTEGENLWKILSIDPPGKGNEKKENEVNESIKEKRAEKKKKLMEKFKKNNSEVINKMLSNSKSLHFNEEEKLCLICHER